MIGADIFENLRCVVLNELILYNADNVSLSVPEEPDLLENIQRGRQEAEALGLEKFIRIFKLYEELHRSRMQMESIDYSPKKESQSHYTLEELFIRVNVIDSLAETQQRNHQDLLEEVLDLKKHLITSVSDIQSSDSFQLGQQYSPLFSTR
ncbi:unnamed protein product [Dibothriocephalus latus]|uniref:Uncharacterized protein n=1 Tax=Dibothriocephalus latus TaxID=60516 RepID=A0A3P7LCZ8_DIBLA|nr:unnamed protein product [Dibothriocephalus latus]